MPLRGGCVCGDWSANGGPRAAAASGAGFFSPRRETDLGGLFVAAGGGAFAEAAWGGREADAAATSPGVCLRHRAQVLLLLPFMRAAEGAEPVGQPGGQLHGVMLGPTADRF